MKNFIKDCGHGLILAIIMLGVIAALSGLINAIENVMAWLHSL